MPPFRIELEVQLAPEACSALSNSITAAMNVMLESEMSDSDFEALCFCLPAAYTTVFTQMLQEKLGGSARQRIEACEIEFSASHDKTAAAPTRLERRQEMVNSVTDELYEALPKLKDALWDGVERIIASVGEPLNTEEAEDVVDLLVEAIDIAPRLEETARSICHKHGLPFAVSYREWRRQNPDSHPRAATAIFFMDLHDTGLQVERLVDHRLLRALAYGGHLAALRRLRGALKKIRGAEFRHLEERCRESERGCKWIIEKELALRSSSIQKAELVKEAQSQGVDAPTVWIQRQLDLRRLYLYRDGKTAMITASEELATHAIRNNTEIRIHPPESGRMPSEDFLDSSIELLGLSPRQTQLLLKAGIRTVRQLLGSSEIDILRVPGIGMRSMREIVSILRATGIRETGK